MDKQNTVCVCTTCSFWHQLPDEVFVDTALPPHGKDAPPRCSVGHVHICISACFPPNYLPKLVNPRDAVSFIPASWDPTATWLTKACVHGFAGKGAIAEVRAMGLGPPGEGGSPVSVAMLTLRLRQLLVPVLQPGDPSLLLPTGTAFLRSSVHP